MRVRRYLAAKALTTCLMASPAYAAAPAHSHHLHAAPPAPASARLHILVAPPAA